MGECFALIAKHSRYVFRHTYVLKAILLESLFNFIQYSVIQTMGIYAWIIYFYIGIPLSSYSKKLYVNVVTNIWRIRNDTLIEPAEWLKKTFEVLPKYYLWSTIFVLNCEYYNLLVYSMIIKFLRCYDLCPFFFICKIVDKMEWQSKN